MTYRISSLAVFAALTLMSACTDDDPGGSGSGEETASETGDSDSNGTETGGATGGDGDCAEPGQAYASFTLDASEGKDVDWDTLCADAEVMADAESGYLIALKDCVTQNDESPPDNFELLIDTSTATEPLIPEDTELRFHWVERPPFIAGRWFTISSADGETLFLAGVDAPTLLPDPDRAPDFGWEPLGVERVSIGCELFEHNSQCGMAERQALEVAWDGLTTSVSDSNSDYVGELVSYEIVVDSALDFPEVSCDDFPNRILRALFLLIPEG